MGINTGIRHAGNQELALCCNRLHTELDITLSVPAAHCLLLLDHAAVHGQVGTVCEHGEPERGATGRDSKKSRHTAVTNIG